MLVQVRIKDTILMSYIAVPVAIAKGLEECRMEIISMVARLTQFVKEPVTSRNLFSRKPSHFAVVFRPQNFESYLPQDIIRLLSREHIFLINSGATISRDYGAFHIMLTFIYTVSWGFGQNE